MSIREDSVHVLGARFLVLDGADPLSGFPLRAPDGSTANPSYSFESDSTSGLSLVSDNLVFGNGGSASLVVGMDGNATLSGGPPSNYASGEGVVLIHEATTIPTSAVGGGSLYVSGNELNFINTDGASITLTAKTGDVSGSGAVTLNSVATFSGVTGKVVQESVLLATDSDTLLGPDGSGGTNFYTFTGDVDTGLFNSSGTLELSAGGSGRVQVGPTNVSCTSGVSVRVPDGSVSSPTYSFTNSSDSGMYVSGTSVHVSASGTDSLIVDDVGGAVPNVAIASSPSNYGVTTPGVGVVFVPEASVIPSGVPNAGTGAVLYVSGDSLNLLNASGMSHDLTKCIEESSGTTTVNGVIRFDGTTGRLVQDTSTLTVDSAGQWAGPVGSAGSPTYSFTSDPDTGMFRSGAGVVGLSTNATSQLTVSSSSMNVVPELVIPSGTGSLPGLAFASTISSGIYLDSSSAVAFASGGASSMAVHSSRNVVMCGASTNAFGGGDGVLWIREASSIPSSNPSSGGLLYASGNTLQYRTPSGTTFTLTDPVAGPGSATDEAFAVFSGVSGEVIQNGVVTGTDAGQLRTGDGNSSNPALSFASDPDTGMYISGADVFLTSGGGDQMFVNGTSVTCGVPLGIPDGSVASPGLSFTSDPNTGFHTGLTNQFSVGVGGQSVVTALGVGSASNLSLTGAMNFGNGEGVVYLGDASVIPAGVLTSGSVLYVSGDNLIQHDDAGTTTTLNSSPTSFISGPDSSGVDQVAFWDSTDGTSFDAAGSVTLTSTQITSNGFRAGVGTSIVDDTSRLAFTTASSNSMLIGTGEVETLIPFHVDAGLRIGGATGVLESVSAANFTTNLLNASGHLIWKVNGSTIFTTDSGDLTTSNSLLFPSGTETLTISSLDATTYGISSTSTGTADDIRFESAAASLTCTTTHSVLGNATVMFSNNTPSMRMAVSQKIHMDDGSIASPAYTYDSSPDSGMMYDSTTSSVGLCAKGKLGLAQSAGASSTNLAFATATFPSSYNGGDGVIYIGEVISLPDENFGGNQMYVSSDDDMRFIIDYTDDDLNTTLNSAARRANITLSSFSVSNSLVRNLDVLIWTDVSSAGVGGATLGSLSIVTEETTVMVILEVKWVSNATGYRRASITTGAGNTVEATSTTNAVSGIETVQTVTLVRRLESGDSNLTFAAQVFQNSGVSLNVDVTMSMIRLN